MSTRQIADLIVDCFRRGNYLYLAGNGGSYDLANHMEEEFICKFEKIREPLPALALKAHTSTSNDFGYEFVFSRSIQAYGKVGDLLIAISTSGKSKNVLNAIEEAEKLNMDVIDFPRKGSSTAKIQENQLKLMHDICRMVEQEYENSK